LDKSPDAFRTISEVADDLDIPQHVLRFWETRFTQIKPMKRSGGRRYYRPDDVDLLKGIRRLLYGEGYTIRGVQRILKEHGIGSVQRLADGSAVASFGAIEEAIGHSILERNPGGARGIDLDDDEYDGATGGAVSHHLAEDDEDAIQGALDGNLDGALDDDEDPLEGPIPGVAASGHQVFDIDRLEAVLQDLIACRALLDMAMKDA
jgi:DNA-binding transcriptional MerR regulator